MSLRIKKADISKKEEYLLGLIDEDSFAKRMYITAEVLDLWVGFGLPFIWFRRKKFFDWRDVWDWLESPNILGEGSNLDLVWKMTPAIMQPHIAEVSGHDILPDGNYVLVPKDVKEKAK